MTHRKAGAIVSMALAFSLSSYVIADDNGRGNRGNGQSNGRGNGGNNGNHGTQADKNNAPVRLRIPLMATQAGTTIGAAGDVTVREQKQRQRIRVHVEATVNDGTTFNVYANGAPIGMITIQFNEGQLQIGTAAGESLPGGLSPDAITTVAVTELNGTPILQGQFAALSTATATANRTRVAMTATAAGSAAGAEGQVIVRRKGLRERLNVSVEANVPDGTVYTITADGTVLGTVTMDLGEGEFELDSEHSTLPSGVVSIASVASIQVIGGDGTVVLTASL